MPRPAKGARLGGSPANERLIIANLCKSLIVNESVVTTEAKAKRVRPHIEKLITKAKKGDTHNRRLALKVLRDREAAYILFEELAPKFEQREGGYTRIVKLPNRKGDNAPMAEISLVLEPVSPKQAVVKEAEKATEKAAQDEVNEESEAAVEESLAEEEGTPSVETEETVVEDTDSDVEAKQEIPADEASAEEANLAADEAAADKQLSAEENRA